MNIGIVSIINGITEWIFSSIIALFFYKNGMKKVKKIFSFYKTMSEYRFLKEGMYLKILTSILILCDLIIVVAILIPRYRVFACIHGIGIQAFYLTTMIANYNKSFDYNCGCFSINTPKHMDFKGILLSLLFLFIFISILLLISQ